MINEAKQVGILYHYTFIGNLLDILRDNILVGGKNGYRYNAVCFTRDGALHTKPRTVVGCGRSVRLVIDGNKLSTTYKIIPRNDTQYTKNNTIKDISGQAQQACITDRITDITKYIIRIDIDKDKTIHYLLYMKFISNNTGKFNWYIDEIKKYNIPIKFVSLGQTSLLRAESIQYIQSLGKIVNLIQSTLNQAKQVGVLYHYTNIYNLESIIQQNMLRSSQWKYRDEFEFIRVHKPKTYNNSPTEVKSVCFTRNKNFHSIVNFGIISARLVIDGNKLSNNYKLFPIRDLVNLKTNKLEVDESQTICVRDILQLNKYIIRIDIDPVVSIFFILMRMGVFDKQQDIHYYNYSIMQAEQQYSDIEQTIKKSNITYKIVSIQPLDVIGHRFSHQYKLFLRHYNNFKTTQ